MPEQNSDVRERRPDEKLLIYYVISAILFGPAFPIVAVYRFFRFRSLRYTFDSEGITMRWGILFRREISLTYARIQDIHLTSNVLERWFGLGRIQIQTASGSAGAEMVIEGLLDYERIRDELYARMRGARDRRTHETTSSAAAPLAAPGAVPAGGPPAAAPAVAELAEALRDAAAELRRLREGLTTLRVPAGGGDEDR